MDGEQVATPESPAGGDVIRPVRTQAGDPAWQVGGYHLVSALLLDPRLGRTHADPNHAPRYSSSVIFGRPQPAKPTEAAEHARMRRVLAPWFSPRRMAAFRPRVEELVAVLLDDLGTHGSPANFHEAVSFPLPALVICELLRVPYEDREDFRRWSDDAADMTDESRSLSGLGSLWEYMLDLVEDKRHHPGDDVLSHLVTGPESDGAVLANDDVAMLGAGLLFAGHETTVAAIDKGVVLLASNPALRQTLLSAPGLVEPAVEEFLRLPDPVADSHVDWAVGLPRWAKADLEIGGRVIRAGELVLLDLQAANLDATVFTSAGTVDVARADKTHLTFGRGAHYCIGAPLARMELQVLFGSVVRRFPTLQLAVPVDQLRPRTHVLT